MMHVLPYCIAVLRQLHSGIIADYVPGLPLGWLSWELSRHTCSALYREDKPRVDDTAIQAPIIRETSIDFASSYRRFGIEEKCGSNFKQASRY
jgi:hypothetical protein